MRHYLLRIGILVAHAVLLPSLLAELPPRDGKAASGPPAAAGPGAAITFPSHIKPLFSEFCVGCHGNEKHKADINLEKVRDAEAILEDRKTWEKVKAMLQSREMPPDKKPQPTEEQRQFLMNFIEYELARLD